LSEIRATTISDETGNGPITLTKQQAAKVWASIDQTSTGHPVDDSYNVSSTSDEGAGLTSISFVNNMSNADYAIAGTAQASSYVGATFTITGRESAGPNTVSSFRADIRDQTNNYIDCKYISFSIHGDLA
jgi:hypothetical protein